MAAPGDLPNFLFNTCAKYKFDTKLFVSWLGETARMCGHFAANAQSASKGKSNNKPKSKTEKKAAKAQDSKAFIRLGEFPALASSNVETPDSDVPWSILLVLKHIIKARRECADWVDNHLGMRSSKRRIWVTNMLSLFSKKFWPYCFRKHQTKRKPRTPWLSRTRTAHWTCLMLSKDLMVKIHLPIWRRWWQNPKDLWNHWGGCWERGY